MAASGEDDHLKAALEAVIKDHVPHARPKMFAMMAPGERRITFSRAEGDVNLTRLQQDLQAVTDVKLEISWECNIPLYHVTYHINGADGGKRGRSLCSSGVWFVIVLFVILAIFTSTPTLPWLNVTKGE
jgi:hypothetical protein